jgi:2-amino-4-hydroxy-6-hydroxymethyldihydropteridine diphosphokinase
MAVHVSSTPEETPKDITDVLLGLGASVGDRLPNLREALGRLQDRNVVIRAVSPVYESPHLGLAPADSDRYPPHLNIVVKADTSLCPESLLDAVQSVEAAGGRVRRERWGPRTIDIDILAYGSVTMASERLALPHPGIAARAFVALPLVDVDPDFRLADGTLLRDRLALEPLRSQPIVKTDLSL